MKNKYLFGLILVMTIGIVIGALGIKEYSLFGIVDVISCPYGGTVGPNGQLSNFRHICPENGAQILWIGVVILVSFLALVYSSIYGIVFKLRSRR